MSLVTKTTVFLTKTTVLRITNNLHGVTSHLNESTSHSQTSRLLTSSLSLAFRCCSSPSNPVYTRCVDSSALVFSLSSHRHSENRFYL